MVDIIKVRLASVKELPYIEKMWKKLEPSNNYQDILIFYLMFRRYIYIAGLDNNPIGFAAGSIKNDIRGHLSAIYVEELYRRHGVGQKLINVLENKFRQENFKKMTLEVKEDNYNAISFYEKNNFVRIGKKPRYYGTKDALLYIKELI
ncbi:GNAT family N-acetyltransferase [Candidatus Methanoliparum sp. LAM-1]|nr:GNAT family N-acetyltransferase [Candidatus Methanoliparum sp. LAM-1]BDC36308.1 hypothetical protein MTLP_09900 [Candidatus Methanoliparum sp. LAM-1]